MQVPVRPGTTVGVPNVIFSCGPDVSVSEGRDVRFTWRLSLFFEASTGSWLILFLPLFLSLHVFKVTA